MPSVAPSSKTRLKELSANQPDRIIGSLEELLKERLLTPCLKKKIQYFRNGILNASSIWRPENAISFR